MRSKLFVPGFSAELFDKALASDADAISFDLEDAVDERSKGQARTMLHDYLAKLTQAPQSKTIVVRVNGLDTSHFQEDIDACVQERVQIINLPKVEDPAAITELGRIITVLEAKRDIRTPIRILATIESPKGLRLAQRIASADDRVMGLQIGFGDLLSPLGIDPYDRDATQHVRFQIRMASAEAGVDAYDGGYVNIADLDGFRQQAQAAQALGFAGKTCIHPSQVGLANEIFMPSRADIDLALRVVAQARLAEEQGQGVFVVDGKLYDGPFTVRAKQLVLRAQELGLI